MYCIFFYRIVLPYKPKAIVFYEGGNDIAAGKSPGEVLTQFKQFVKTAEEKLPGISIYFSSIKPRIARERVWPQMQQINRLIEKYCLVKEKLHFIDISTSVLADDGKIRWDIFLEEGVHMNEKGYKIWTGIIKAQLSGQK